jgi:hypothetical protein
MIKSIIFAILCTVASASTVVYNGSAFRSTTSYENGRYTYLYAIDLWKLTDRQLYSFNVFWCSGSTADSFKSNIEFDTELREDQVIFHDLSRDDDDDDEENDDDDDDDGNRTITFSFESDSAPVEGTVKYKAGMTTWESTARVPCATIPETSSVVLLMMSALILTRRKR